jgi:hypothetical protein
LHKPSPRCPTYDLPSRLICQIKARGSAPLSYAFCDMPQPSNGSMVVDLISSIDNSAVTLCTRTSEISAW